LACAAKLSFRGYLKTFDFDGQMTCDALPKLTPINASESPVNFVDLGDVPIAQSIEQLYSAFIRRLIKPIGVLFGLSLFLDNVPERHRHLVSAFRQLVEMLPDFDFIHG